MFKGKYTEFSSHFAMICDEHRTSGFYNAIKTKLIPGDVVVDFGSGTGILSVMCAKLGASKVHAVEQNFELVEIIKELAAENGVLDRIVIHNTTSDKFLEYFNEEVDLIVSEGIGDHIFESRLIYDFLKFKEKFPVTKSIPEHFELYCFPEFITLRHDELNIIGKQYGLDLNPIKKLSNPDLDSSYISDQLQDFFYTLPSSNKDNILLFSFSSLSDLQAYEIDNKITCKINLNQQTNGNNYLMVFFKINLTDKIVITNSPKRKNSKHSYYQRLIKCNNVNNSYIILNVDHKMHKINVEDRPYPNIGIY